MKKTIFLFYGLLCYAVFVATFLYSIGFVGNLWVPKSIDSAPTNTLGNALIINALLLLLFAVQHSVMARPKFKKWWTKIIPAAAERSTYVLLASGCLIILFLFWQPMGGIVWQVHNAIAEKVLYVLFFLGWLIVFLSTFMINHFDLFGLRQVYLYYTGKKYEPLSFKTPAFYATVRHPIYLGFIIAFWATPVMTIAHLVFAIATTAYMLVAIQFEEHDLISFYGDTYRKYKREVSMLIPWMSKK